MSLKEYVKKEFYELAENCITVKDIMEFIRQSKDLDSVVYDSIINVGTEGLIDALATFGIDEPVNAMVDVQNVMIENSRKEIKYLISEIQEDEETETMTEHEHNGFNNESDLNSYKNG